MDTNRHPCRYPSQYPRVHNVGIGWKPGALILAELPELATEERVGSFHWVTHTSATWGLSVPVERDLPLSTEHTYSTIQTDPGPPAPLAGRSQTVSCSWTVSCPWVISCSLICPLTSATKQVVIAMKAGKEMESWGCRRCDSWLPG